MRILVVVDMQKDFIDGALGTNEAITIVPRVIEKIKKFDGDMIITHDTHGNNYLGTLEGRTLPVVHCIQGTEGWKLHDEVFLAVNNRIRAGTANAQVFMKPTFGSVELGKYLADKNTDENIEEIVLVGLCTDICVISNALLVKAFLPEVKVTVDAACCAGVTPESHENALRAMKVCQVNIENWEG